MAASLESHTLVIATSRTPDSQVSMQPWRPHQHSPPRSSFQSGRPGQRVVTSLAGNGIGSAQQPPVDGDATTDTRAEDHGETFAAPAAAPSRVSDTARQSASLAT